MKQITITQAAEITGESRQTIRNRVKAGVLKASRRVKGGKLYLLEYDVKMYCKFRDAMKTK